MELVLLLVLLAVFLVGIFVFKLPLSVSMALGSIAAMLVGGFGLQILQLVEGSFAFVDTILIIATAMIFMQVVSASGALEGINAGIIKTFHKVPAVMIILLMFIVMIPGMITGSSTTSVLTTGTLVAPVLVAIGLPKPKVGAFIAMGGILGLVAPPINLPVMIIGGGIDMPYAGFAIPLLAMVVPLAIFSALFIGLKDSKNINIEEIGKEIDLDIKVSFAVYIPIIVVVVLIALCQLMPTVIPNLGMPLIFMIGSLVGLFFSKEKNFFKISKTAINTTLPVMSLLMSVGGLIQVMTLTGIRGFIVSSVLRLPTMLRYVAIAFALPLFGAVSAFASSSVIGVPFMFADLGNNQIITATGISMLAAIGDIMPPAALACYFSAKVLKMDGYMPIFKKCIIPALVCILWAMVFIVFANKLAFLVI